MPKACYNTVLFLLQNYIWMAWDYPNRLQTRFHDAGNYIYLLGPQKSINGLAGVNTAEELAKTPQDWRMGILTDSIETIATEVRKNAQKQ